MFSDKSNEAVGFESCWKTERELQDEEIQTLPCSYKEQETQSVKNKNEETQTDNVQKQMMAEDKVDFEKLAEFLRRVEPKVMTELMKAQRSRAFSGYEPLEDSIDGDVKKLYDLQPPKNAATNEMKVSSLCWSCTGGVVAFGYSCPQHEDWCDHSSNVHLFNINRQDFSTQTPSKTLECSSCICSLSAHPFEPSILAAGTYSGEVVVWNLQKDDDCLICSSASMPGSHRDAVSQVSWVRNPDSTQQRPLLVSAGCDGRILLWQVGTHSGNLQLSEGFVITLERIKYLSPDMTVPSPVGGSGIGLELGITCFSFSTVDLSSFVVGVDGGGLLHCSTITTRPAPVDTDVPLKDPVLKAFDKHQGAVTCVQCSPHREDKFISCGIDNQIRVYLMKQAAPVQIINVEKGVVGLEWSLAHASIFSAWGSVSHCVDFYNSNTGEVIPYMQLPASEKPAPITIVRCNPSSLHLIAVGDMHGRVSIWKQRSYK